MFLDDGRMRPKHVEGLPRACILLYLTIVQLLEYMLSPSCLYPLLNILVRNEATEIPQNRASLRSGSACDLFNMRPVQI